jgi:guanine nucleotide-binding protein subunit alpha
MLSAASSSATTPIWYMQDYYDEGAERISNVIDEGLKVLHFIFLED